MLFLVANEDNNSAVEMAPLDVDLTAAKRKVHSSTIIKYTHRKYTHQKVFLNKFHKGISKKTIKFLQIIRYDMMI